MKYINLFFHIYQPPVQDIDTLNQIVKETYSPLTSQIKKFSDLKFTLNINYSLVEQLSRPFPKIIGNIKSAYEKGNLELTTSGAYHPIFPLIPNDETERQLRINDERNRQLLCHSFKPKGVFPPEMAFGDHLVSLFKSMGYEWTIVDDSIPGYYGIEIPYNKIYTCDGLAVFLRSNFWSNKFAKYSGQWQHGKDFVRELSYELDSWIGNEDGYLIIALDGETFGHHHPELGERFLIELFQAFHDSKDKLRLAHISEIYKKFPKVAQFIPPCSWSTNYEDFENRDYFSWWKSYIDEGHKNNIHALQWEFTNFVLEKVRSLQGNEEINNEMDKALFSCQYWWASIWKFNPSEIYKGAFNMMRILQRTAELLGHNYEQIKEGEEIFRKLVTEVEKERNHKEEVKHG